MRAVAILVLAAACAAEAPYMPDVASGTRLAAEWLVAADGTRHFHRWIDRRTGEESWPANTTDVIEPYAGGELAAWIRIGDDGSREQLATPWHVANDRPCYVDETDLGWRCRAGSFIRDHERLELRVLGEARLRHVVLVEPDGDWRSPPRAIRDTALAIDCVFRPVGGTFRCVPPEVPGVPRRAYADPQCTDARGDVLVVDQVPATGLATRCTVVDATEERCLDVAVLHLGAPRDGVFVEDGGGCLALPADRIALPIDGEVPVETFVNAVPVLDP